MRPGTSRPPPRRRALVAALAAALVTALAPSLACCGVEERWARGDLGVLRVENAPLSLGTVERVEAWARASGAYGFDTLLARGESDTFEVEPDDYEVEVHSTDGSAQTFHDVHVRSEGTTVVVATR